MQNTSKFKAFITEKHSLVMIKMHIVDFSE